MLQNPQLTIPPTDSNKAKTKPKSMNIIEIKNELERIDRLIRLKATGNPKELADKLGVSERHVY